MSNLSFPVSSLENQANLKSAEDADASLQNLEVKLRKRATKTNIRLCLANRPAIHSLCMYLCMIFPKSIDSTMDHAMHYDQMPVCQ